MAKVLKNGWTVDIEINGVSLPLNPEILHGVEIIESINYLFPVLRLRYDPRSQVFQNFAPFTGMEDVNIRLSKDQDPVFESLSETFEEYKVASYESVQERNSDPTAPVFELNCLLSPFETLSDGDQKSWKGTVSDVVENIMTDVLFISSSNFMVESTHETLNQTWVQPNISYKSFLNYLTKKAYSTRKLGPYFSYFQSNGEFNFRSLDNLYNQTVPENRQWYFAPNLTHEGGVPDDDPAENKRKNVIVTFEYNNESKEALTTGALGTKSFGFDLKTGEYKQDGYHITDLEKHVTLTNRLLFDRDDELSDQQAFENDRSYLGALYGGQDETEAVSRSEVIEKNLEITQLDTVVRHDISDDTVGSKVSTNILDLQAPGKIQENLSGQWIIAEKRRIMKPNELYFRYKLIRDGVSPTTEQRTRFGKGRKLNQ